MSVDLDGAEGARAAGDIPLRGCGTCRGEGMERVAITRIA
jgi:hypothetical protein